MRSIYSKLLVLSPICPPPYKAVRGVIATTARERAIPTLLETPRQALPWLIDNTQHTALIFGREDSGLTNAELNYAQRYIRIPVGSEYSSLNLAQAVGVCAYELQMSVQNTDSSIPIPSPPQPTDIAPVELVEGYYQQLEALLLDIGYLLPHTALHRMEKIRRLYNRSQLSPNEVALLRGILRQVKWSIDRTSDS